MKNRRRKNSLENHVVVPIKIWEVDAKTSNDDDYEECQAHSSSDDVIKYVAMITRSFGIAPLTGPHIIKVGSEKYKFDFQHAKSDTIFKIFTTIDYKNLHRYCEFGRGCPTSNLKMILDLNQAASSQFDLALFVKIISQYHDIAERYGINKALYFMIEGNLLGEAGTI